MKTFMAHDKDVVRKWYVVDAEGMVLGRLASQVAAILRGKNKPTFTPNVDTGDFVIIVNSERNFTDITPAISAVLNPFSTKL